MSLTTWRSCCDSRWPGAHTSLCQKTRTEDTIFCMGCGGTRKVSEPPCTCRLDKKEAMMDKSRLKLKDHTLRGEDKVIEVWHHDELVATVTGADGPGVRVLTKYPLDIVRGGHSGMGAAVNMVEVRIEV